MGSPFESMFPISGPILHGDVTMTPEMDYRKPINKLRKFCLSAENNRAK